MIEPDGVCLFELWRPFPKVLERALRERLQRADHSDTMLLLDRLAPVDLPAKLAGIERWMVCSLEDREQFTLYPAGPLAHRAT